MSKSIPLLKPRTGRHTPEAWLRTCTHIHEAPLRPGNGEAITPVFQMGKGRGRSACASAAPVAMCSREARRDATTRPPAWLRSARRTTRINQALARTGAIRALTGVCHGGVESMTAWVSTNLNIHVSCEPAVPLRGIYPRDRSTCVHKDRKDNAQSGFVHTGGRPSVHQ